MDRKGKQKLKRYFIVYVIFAVFFTVVSIGMKSGIEPITGAVVGGLMGFLLFNVYPASVFMGDTGSLALG